MRDFSGSTLPAALIDSLLRRIDYWHYLDDGTPQGESRQENVKELISVAQTYQDMGLDGFLEEVTLMSDIDQANFNTAGVTLMTLHAAKRLGVSGRLWHRSAWKKLFSRIPDLYTTNLKWKKNGGCVMSA